MPHSLETVDNAWQRTLGKALEQRVDPRRLEQAISHLSKTDDPPSELILLTILNARVGSTFDKDPLVARYLDLLLQQKCIQPSGLLLRTLDISPFSTNGAEATAATSTSGLPTFEEKVFTIVRASLEDGLYTAHPSKLHKLILAATKWLHTVSNFEVARQVELGPVHAISAAAATMYEALGLLAYSIFSNKGISAVEKQPWWNSRRALIMSELEKFDINVLQIAQSQLGGYLCNLRTQRPFLDTDADGKPTFTTEQVLDMFQARPQVTTRAGLFVWLSACLDSRPLTDDATMRNYLLVRYQDDPQNATMGIILATFDVLSTTKSSDDNTHRQKLVASFLCNKLPLLLTSFATLMPTQAFENCISMAFLSLHSEAPPPADSTQSVFRQAKQDFLRASLLHGIISESTLITLLPEHSTSTPKPVRHNRANLVAQCSANPTKLDDLLGELDSMTGNVGAIAGCIVDTISMLCSSKDIMTLKNVCSKLLRRIPSMNFVLQYIQPALFLVPICQLLNDWTHDQDQTDFQPPYEDFACIFLFVNAVIRRYGLSRATLGITNDESFLARYLTSGTASIPLSDLSELQSTQLSHWIQGLYATDDGGEIVGITDEVYSTCPPQSFYLLVPTIFEQTVIACKAKALTPAIMKAGLEFLLEPFLLPSLVSGLLWLSSSTWKDVEDTAIRLQILDKVLKIASTSQEVQVMHRAAVTMVADQVDRALQHLLRVTSQKKKEINATIQLLKPYCDQPDLAGRIFDSTASSDNANNAHDKLEAQLRGYVHDLTVWTSESTTSTPSNSNYRTVRQCSQVLGNSRTTEVLVGIFAEQLNSSIEPASLDICSAIIIAPDAQRYTTVSTTVMTTTDNQRTMADCLRLTAADTENLLRMSPKHAEAVVRLQRSVATQSTVSQLASQLEMVTMALPAQNAADQVMQDLGLATADGSLDAAAAAVLAGTTAGDFDGAALGLGDPTSQDIQNIVANPDMLDLGQTQDIFGDLGMDLSTGNAQLAAFGATNAGEQIADTNPDDDIFGDLDMTGFGGSYDFS